MLAPRPYLWIASQTCMASSRVGTRTKPRGRLDGPSAIDWIIGSAKAAVFPEKQTKKQDHLMPVAAWPLPADRGRRGVMESSRAAPASAPRSPAPSVPPGWRRRGRAPQTHQATHAFAKKPSSYHHIVAAADSPRVSLKVVFGRQSQKPSGQATRRASFRCTRDVWLPDVQTFERLQQALPGQAEIARGA